MVDLEKIFFEDFRTDKAGYYNSLEDLVEFVGEELNELKAVGKAKFTIYDDESAISKFKAIIQPEYRIDNIGLFEFYLICYYLYKQGYYIKQFPSFLSRPYNPEKFSNAEIRSLADSKYGNTDGTVKWNDRRKIISELEFIKSPNSNIIVSQNLQDLFASISTRNAQFNDQAIDEKLASIRNVFENIGKINNKYIDIPWEDLTCNYLKKGDVENFANELQCFRHGEKTLLEKRNKYTDEQKMSMVDYGLLILSIAERYLLK